jgi:NitT/TauT family transport system ATP-binding protein
VTPAAPELAAVTLDNVSKTFSSGVQALAPLTLSIKPRSFTSLVGPSGCGKSTLLRLIARLITPTSGRVDRGVADTSRDVSYVFQDATLMPWATVAENIALPLKLGGVPSAECEKRVVAAAERVGLSEFLRAYPRELSGGMKMRVSIARAIITGPRLLLMDEPFAALDEFTRFRLNDDLLALWQQNLWTVVFVTHSIREAVFLSERVVVMSPHPGRIIADIAVDLPFPRHPPLRLHHAFIDQCARVSAVLDDAHHRGSRA